MSERITLQFYNRTEPDAISGEPVTIGNYLEERLDLLDTSIRRPDKEARVLAMQKVCAKCSLLFDCGSIFTSKGEALPIRVNGSGVGSSDCLLKSKGLR